VIEAALLLEIGLEKLTDEVWLVEAPMEDKLERIYRRDGLSLREATLRLSAQMSDEEMRPFAQRIINNNGSVECLREKVIGFYEELPR